MNGRNRSTERAVLWQRSEGVFAELVELSKERQVSALESLRMEDPECAERVARLLAADRMASEQFLAPREYTFEAVGGGERAEEEIEAEGYSMVKGERVGPFRIERPIGRGGMGEVFLARRIAEDEEEGFTQVVALKVIRPVYGRSQEELRQRFLRERRILARLTHPSIARLVDGGSTADGRPYLAMEFVAGESITKVCWEQGLDMSSRLALFLQACRAVQFAHENLVVHRDLKPSNVLVEMASDASGRSKALSASASSGGASVKLLDFGIAGWLEGFESETPLTRTGRAPATPDYAAPEQLRGEPIGTTTDVFALGLLLFELLAGARPSGWPPRGQASEGRTPPVPMPRSERGIDHIPDDLSSVVQRAIEEDPARRYGTAAALIDDIERFEAGLPVVARQGNDWYRVRKFVARNRLSIAGCLALFAVVLAGLVGTLTQAARAERNAGRAERVTELLTEVFEGSDPARTRGQQLTAVELLDVGAGRIAADLADEPRLRAEIETVLGRLYFSLGSYEQADALLSSAVALHRASGERGRLMVDALNQLAELRRQTGDLERAKELLVEASENVQFDRNMPVQLRQDTEASLGAVQMALGEREAGLALLESAHAGRLARGVHGFDLAQSNGQLGDALLEAGELGRAETLFREAVVVLEKAILGEALVGSGIIKDSEISDPRLAKAQSDLGVALILMGRHDEALEPLRRSLDARRKVFGGRHVEVAHSLRNLSGAVRAVGDTEEGLAMLEESLAIYRALFGDQHPDVAETFNNLAVARVQSGDLEGAVEMFERAVASQRGQFGTEHPSLVLPLSSLGNLLTSLGSLPAAEQHLKEARRLSLSKLEEGHPHRALVAHNLAGVYLVTQRFDLARPLLEEAVVGFKAALGDEHPNVGIALFSLGKVGLALEPQRTDSARSALENFVAGSTILRMAPPQLAGRLAGSLVGEAKALLRLDRASEAIPPLLEAHAIVGPAEGESAPSQQACEIDELLQRAVGRAPDLDGGIDKAVSRALEVLAGCTAAE